MGNVLVFSKPAPGAPDERSRYLINVADHPAVLNRALWIHPHGDVADLNADF